MEVEDMKPQVSSKLKVSEDVIIAIARIAALDVKGVAGLGGEVGKMSKLRKNGPIKISMMGDVAAVDMRIIIKSGEKACNIAQEVQTAVKTAVIQREGDFAAR